ncbi:MAG: DUF3108 domain-containing protein [Verrucomicrobiae bacterium]|nr:DUF3108 domain-containing protein [Verrucomicrobiae bacterium]
MRIMQVIVAVLLAAVASGGELPFRVGEKLCYRIYWGPLEAGVASLEVAGVEMVEGRGCYRFVARAQTSGLVDMLFHVDNVLESWMDAKELCSVRYRQRRIEGKRVRHSETRYDYEAGRCVITNYLKQTCQVMPLDEPLQDLLSAVYYVRSRALELNRPLEFVVNAGDANHRVRVQPDQRKMVWTKPLGTRAALRVEPHPTLNVVAAHKGRMWIWVSDDVQKVPLVVISRLAIGSARFQLTAVEYVDPTTPQRSRDASRS